MSNVDAVAPSLSYDQAATILSNLPPTAFSFAYGSAIIPQRNVVSSSRMIDLILAVDDPIRWHHDNLQRNPAHYSFISLMGANIVSATQTGFGAKVYFNTIMGSMPFKYGVVSVEDLVNDLVNWENLYVSGRMQKPIRWLSNPNMRLRKAMKSNINAASAAALLTLPEKFSESDLYAAITSLSYTKDIRTTLSMEAHTKVQDIVRMNMNRFRNMYSQSTGLQFISRGRDGIWRRDIADSTQQQLLAALPVGMRRRIANTLGSSDVEGVASVEKTRLSQAVVAAIGAVVARSSLRQTMKGVLTAGLGTSARYVASKFFKAVGSRLRTS